MFGNKQTTEQEPSKVYKNESEQTKVSLTSRAIEDIIPQFTEVLALCASPVERMNGGIIKECAYTGVWDGIVVLVKRPEACQKWVVGRNAHPAKGYWGSGFYFDSYEDAWAYLEMKYKDRSTLYRRNE